MSILLKIRAGFLAATTFEQEVGKSTLLFPYDDSVNLNVTPGNIGASLFLASCLSA